MPDTRTEATVQDDHIVASGTAPRRTVPAWLVGVAMVTLIGLGIAIGLLAPALTRPGDDSPEAGFARDMTNHHAQAVSMGLIAFGNSTTDGVRTMGRDIATNQQGQIGMMQAWLEEWELNPTGSKPPMAWMPDAAGSVTNGLMPGMATPEQMTELRTARGKALDVLFIKLMRQHHLGGIHMAEEIVKVSDEDEVLRLAQRAVDGQRRELADLQTLLTEVEKMP
jgi:uncharacterized protein (DUF305 family)